MKGWVLVKSGNVVFNSSNSIEVFKTKNDLFDYHEEVFGSLKRIKRLGYKMKRVEYAIAK